MAITSIKIHPAIGIARVGNSPDEFFIGPEKPWERPNPPGGFKDNHCRVKRQAARFRVFAYNDDGTVEELAAEDAQITWTVHLVNKKAVTRNAGAAAALIINPGPRTLTGPNQQQIFNNGQITLPGASAETVPLGEIRTDTDGHLLVFGGFGKSKTPMGAGLADFYDNAGWYDDISDGPVTATVLIHGTTYTAVGAWVIVAPPKFAPDIDNVITLYDTLFDLAVQQSWLAGPNPPSYTQHIYPILQRARDTKWVVQIGNFPHSWSDPVVNAVTSNAIFNKLKNPSGGVGGNMPRLNSATLTDTQYETMRKWKDGNFNNDWAGVPSPPTQITAQGLDQAALENCVGAAFFPGIEAGGISANPIIDPSNYVEPFRLSHSILAAGDVSAHMALPWQADFFACDDDWWPVPRPNQVLPQGASTREDWDRDVGSNVDMVNSWHTLGFVVRQGNQQLEVDRCAGTFITLLTPHLNFQDVPQGPLGTARKTALAIVFEIKSTGGPVTLDIQTPPAHPRLVPLSNSDTEGPTSGNAIATSRLWIIYETGPVNEVINDQVVVRHAASGQTWTITISANTVARKIAAAALVLDRSGSMSEDRGDGENKHRSLQQAASIFVDVMLEGDGVGLVRYNHDAQLLQAVTVLGPDDDPFDLSRANTKSLIMGSQLNPSGATSIGDGIFEGRQALNAAGAGFDVKAIVVLTDGKENSARWIADVAADINARTYAVGLGTPQNTSAPVLQNLSGNHGGYLLITGAITGDKQFILKKYFLQILAGISNAEIVLDPNGELLPGVEQRIPFQITEADAAMDVILLTPFPRYIDFRLQTPNGLIIEPWRAMAEPAMRYVLSDGVTYYRLALPTELIAGRFDRQGTWHALLNVGKPRLSSGDDVRVQRVAGARLNESRFTAAVATTHVQGRRTLPYSLLVHSYSNLSFRASLQQASFEPGASVVLHASLAESGVPMAQNAQVWAEIIRPDSSMAQVVLREVAEGQFSASYVTSLPGVYRFRVRASGRSRAGHPFQREQTLTAAVWHGGNYVADPNNAGGGPEVRGQRERDEKFCKLLECLFGERMLTPEVERQLRAWGMDVDHLRRCLQQYCQPAPPEPGNEDTGRPSYRSGSGPGTTNPFEYLGPSRCQ